MAKSQPQNGQNPASEGKGRVKGDRPPWTQKQKPKQTKQKPKQKHKQTGGQAQPPRESESTNYTVSGYQLDQLWGLKGAF
jgi:hypothetical protein